MALRKLFKVSRYGGKIQFLNIKSVSIIDLPDGWKHAQTHNNTIVGTEVITVLLHAFEPGSNLESAYIMAPRELCKVSKYVGMIYFSYF